MKFVGVMTGTSMDGLDVALLETGTAAPTVHAGCTVPLPVELVDALAALAKPGDDEVERLGRADAALGEFIGQAVLDCLGRWRTRPADIRAIGCHGQTIRHRPDAEPPFTLQIGDPNRVAESTGITTVADFRRRDMAAGGQGAPLAPLFHEALFRDAARGRVVVNVGGIANATFLPPGVPTLLGFDTGPGNALLDAWTDHCLGEAFDRDGRWAATGRIDAGLLARLRQDPFIARRPPKSTGKETYNLRYVQAACMGLDIRPQNVQATIAAFTAWSIAQAIRCHASAPSDVAVCGGGRRNSHLMRLLEAGLPQHRILTTDELGVDGDSLEAAAFAWFAHRTLAGEPGNAPAVTGAAGPRILGAIHPG